ncbi:hypothetical protein CFC21_106493 [Triticum aestivum]|uniref:Bifunctional inhibitor/plant lipid transfer protein/seed storage helical domain-containing protein n=4 Tax=Triticinae TaxID=1648030 RepID=A0A452ZNZ1_AEGTS|nr:hypothetical protein CFC21_106493 [Triticum aestivum]
MVSSRVLLLVVAILLCMASVQASGQSLTPPAEGAPAPAPSACGGDHCTLSDIVKLEVCLDLQLGRMSPGAKDRCCRRIRAMPNAAGCLRVAFIRADLRFHANIDNRVNAVLTACGTATVLDRACLVPLFGRRHLGLAGDPQ